MLTSKGSTAAACMTNGPFVTGLSEGRLMLQCCVSCEGWQHYPRPICKNCSGRELVFAASSGKGHVYSFSRLHVAPTPFYKPFLPYLVVLVDMEEGPRVMGHMANVEGLSIGDPVIFSALALEQDGPKVIGFERASGSGDHA